MYNWAWRAWRSTQRSCVEVMCGDPAWRSCEEVERGQGPQQVGTVDMRGGCVQWMGTVDVRGGCVWRSCKEVVRGGWVQRLGKEAHHQWLWADLFVIPNGREQHEQEAIPLLPVPGIPPRDLSLLSWLRALEGGGGSQAEERRGNWPATGAWSRVSRMQGYPSGKQHIKRIKRSTGAIKPWGSVEGSTAGKHRQENVQATLKEYRNYPKTMAYYGILCHHTYSFIVLV
ncbi:hypothetical protein DFH08DRAFT_796430 [Mycena albidolilacea]|uniref:Uncharacterized protein n=1 Tax=Mycena albidolilacea TaxID=1033008 RepID=A0AAD7F4N6_9AGAR|nr:hypothetical protein DFH08DRAFT_796430 [Mycena albidolilacea]